MEINLPVSETCGKKVSEFPKEETLNSKDTGNSGNALDNAVFMNETNFRSNSNTPDGLKYFNLIPEESGSLNPTNASDNDNFYNDVRQKNCSN